MLLLAGGIYAPPSSEVKWYVYVRSCYIVTNFGKVYLLQILKSKILAKSDDGSS